MKIFWFKRLKDEFHFPVDNELQASKLYRRHDFKLQYQYIGWSDGKLFNEMIGKMNKMAGRHVTKSETGESIDVTFAPKLDDQRMQLKKDAMKAELKVAIDNPDKTPPKSSDVMDLNGRPADSSMVGFIKMMGR